MICSTRRVLAVAVVSMLGFVTSCADKKAEEVVAPPAAVEAPVAPAAEVIPEAPPAAAPEKAVKASKKAKKAVKK